MTGFEAFGPVRKNPSEAVLALLPDQVEGHTLSTAILPVDAVRIAPKLQALYAGGFDLVIHTGVARERSYFSLEELAHNHLNFDLPDNAGRTLQGQPIEPQGPPTLRTRLPIEAIRGAWDQLGVAQQRSEDAGTYLCNQTFYLALHWLEENIPAGFIHLPPDEHMAPDGPHVPLAVQAKVVIAAVRAALGPELVS